MGVPCTIVNEEARPINLYRNGRNARILANPAGVIGDEFEFANETAREGAIRKLAEETGLSCKKIIQLTENPIMVSPGLTDESTYYFKAIVDELKPVAKAKTDGGVTRAWHVVPLENLNEWIKTMMQRGKMPSGQFLTGIALDFLSKFK